MDSIDLKSFLLGVGVAFVFGFISQRFRLARSAAGAYYKPQSVTMFTKKSPAQVASSCTRQVFVFVLVLAIVIALVYLASKYIL